MDTITSDEYTEISKKVYEIVKNILTENNIETSEQIIETLTIHLSLVISRKLNDSYYTSSESQLASLKTSELYPVAREITKALSSEFELTIEKVERYYIILYLLNKNLLDLEFDFDYDIDDHLLKEVLDETVASINEELKLNVSHDSEFFKSLSLHLYPAITRLLEDDQINYNPIIDEITDGYKEAHECATILNQKIKKYYGKAFNPYELSFITLHFGVALENRG